MKWKLLILSILVLSCAEQKEDIEEYTSVSKTAPIYPKEALMMGIEGHCILSFTITSEGYTAKIKAVECSNEIFELAAIKAVSAYQYAPRKIAGKAVEVAGIEEKFTFKIQEQTQ